MKRPMITIDECMSMSEKELNEFLDRDEKFLQEGMIDESQPNVDLMGMSDEEILEASEVFPLPDGRFLIVEG